MILLTGTFVEPNESRMVEYVKSLSLNAANPSIRRIVLLIEEDEAGYHERIAASERESLRALFGLLFDPKVDVVPHGRRATYSDFFSKADALAEGDVTCVANADIWFDETLALLDAVDWRRTFVALSRWADRTVAGSQDAWFYRPPCRIRNAVDVVLGTPGCDNRIAWEAANVMYSVSNFSLSVRAHHEHGSGVRTWDSGRTCPGPYWSNVTPSSL